MTEQEIQEWMAQRKELGEAISKLQLQFEETLVIIQQIKQRSVATQVYDLAAHARDMEKKILEVKQLFEKNIC